jgi:hypothetical protein
MRGAVRKRSWKKISHKLSEFLFSIVRGNYDFYKWTNKNYLPSPLEILTVDRAATAEIP